MNVYERLKIKSGTKCRKRLAALTSLCKGTPNKEYRRNYLGIRLYLIFVAIDTELKRIFVNISHGHYMNAISLLQL
uniref:Uncharacterized protein n=1 Tax=Pararge aegeria TaxID=116150 RepID=S4PRF0_9NEOP